MAHPLFLVALLLFAPLARALEPVDHRIRLDLDPARLELRVEDRLTLPPELAGAGPVAVRLNAGFADLSVEGARIVSSEPAAGGRLRDHVLRLEPGRRVVVLRYSGSPRLSDTGDGPGEWFDADGAHLGAGSGWYPRVAGMLLVADVRVTLPPEWRALVPGDSIGDAGEWRWRTVRPVEDLDLVAGPFVEYRRDEPFGYSRVWLRQAGPALAATYLDAVGRYLPFYARLLGEYPYPGFAVVENLRPTGWGMPGFTLLGSRVMRLPFIPHTSLPHEVLHNWWGNGVLVDVDEGNWSEGLTAYLADHLLAQRRGQGVRHRRDALARFRSAGRGAVAPVHFVARHDRRSQTAGYDKPMMLFHMARGARGDAAFVEALRSLYREGLGRRVGAREVLAALAPEGEDWFGEWWLRADAPRLELECCEVSGEEGAWRVRGLLRQVQEGAPYRLRVPLQVLTADGAPGQEHVVVMSGATGAFAIETGARPVVVTADARFDLMRIPHRDELPPSLGEALDADDPVAVIDPAVDDGLAAAYRALAARMGARVLPDATVPDGAGAVWLLGRGAPGAAPWVDALDSAIEQGASRVLAARGASGQPVVLLDAESARAAAALAAKLGHYGRYGLLGFDGDGARNVFKGERPAAASPLRVVLDEAAASQVVPLLPERALEAP